VHDRHWGSDSYKICSVILDALSVFQQTKTHNLFFQPVENSVPQLKFLMKAEHIILKEGKVPLHQKGWAKT
jgi:hypothetical protein